MRRSRLGQRDAPPVPPHHAPANDDAPASGSPKLKVAPNSWPFPNKCSGLEMARGSDSDFWETAVRSLLAWPVYSLPL